MKIGLDILRPAKLGDVYPPYAKKLEECISVLRSNDASGADDIFSQASELYCAFHAGVEYAKRGRK